MSEHDRAKIDTEVRDMPRGMLIKTKFVSCTDYRPSRCKAICIAPWGKVTVTRSWDHALDGLGNHLVVARLLAEKLSRENDYYDYVVTTHGWDDSDFYYWIAECKPLAVLLDEQGYNF